MESISDMYQGPDPEERLITRPNRVAIILGSKLPTTPPKALEDTLRFFSPLGIRVLAASSLQEQEKMDSSRLYDFDVVGLIGAPREFSFLRSFRPRSEGPIVLAFAPKTQFGFSKRYLRISDAVVLCESSRNDWFSEISNVIFHFFESLVVPSLLNIDIADVKNIARGIGLAFNESDDLPTGIISRLPDSCLVARSALLHFSCAEEVKLREIYSISKTIAMKQGVELTETDLQTDKDAMKLIRRVNVKMGIRIREGLRSAVESRLQPQVETGRISMTAILFGI